MSKIYLARYECDLYLAQYEYKQSAHLRATWPGICLSYCSGMIVSYLVRYECNNLAPYECE